MNNILGHRSVISFVLCFALATVLLTGCGRSKKSEDKVIATVNGEPIYVKDFNRTLALNAKRDPSFKVTPETLDEQMNFLVDRKILIQQAIKGKLDQTEKFRNTIKTFWEQTLIRDLMEQEGVKFEPSISVSQAEIESFYEKLKEKNPSVEVPPLGEIKAQVKERIFNLKKQQKLQAWLDGIKEKSKIDVDKKVLMEQK